MKSTQKKKKSHKTGKDVNEQVSSNSFTERKGAGTEKLKTRKPDEKKVIDSKAKKNRHNFAFFSIATHFLRDAKIELKKVKWPSRKELIASTIMVLILVIAVAFYLGVVDFFLNMIINKIIG